MPNQHHPALYVRNTSTRAARFAPARWMFCTAMVFVGVNPIRIMESAPRFKTFPRHARRFRLLLWKAIAKARLSEGEAVTILDGDYLDIRQLIAETLEELGVEEIDHITFDLTDRVR
jgi:hypothetical protein